MRRLTQQGWLEYSITEQDGRYGVCIDERTARGLTRNAALSLTDDLPRAIALLGLLWHGRVTPAQLKALLSGEGGTISTK